MKLRIKPHEIGSLGSRDWQRVYLVQVKTFLLRSTWKQFDSIEQGIELIKLFKVKSITYGIL